MSQEFLEQSIRLIDLVPEEGILRDLDFTRCQLGGPAVLWLEEDTVQMKGCHFVPAFGSDTPAGFWWDPPAEWTYGAILVSNCTFLQCGFLLVGFTGSPEMKRRFLAGFDERSA